jgi:hypothetical protein
MEIEDDLSLDDAIGAALDEQAIAPEGEQPAKGAKQDNPFPTADELPSKAPAAKEYVREGRRFVLKDGKETEVKDAAAETAPPAKAWSPLWLKPDHGVEWDKLPEGFRKALEQREREAAQGIEKHATSAKAWEPIAQEIAPIAHELAAQGLSPQQHVSNLLKAEVYLKQSPVDAINWLCQSYLGQGWDVPALAQWMGEQGHQAQKIDPVQQELYTVKQKLAALESNGANAQRAALERDIAAWSKDKPYFEDVKREMAALARSKPGATLDELYEQATWAHPSIRQRILDDQRKADVKRARDSSLGTRGTPTPNGSSRSSPKLSLEEEIGMLLDGGSV